MGFDSQSISDAAITIEPDRYYLGLWFLEIEEKGVNFLLTASRKLDDAEPADWVVEYRWRDISDPGPVTCTSGVYPAKTAIEVEAEIDSLLKHLTSLEFKDGPKGHPDNLRIFDFYPAHCGGRELSDRLIVAPAAWMCERAVE